MSLVESDWADEQYHRQQRLASRVSTHASDDMADAMAYARQVDTSVFPDVLYLEGGKVGLDKLAGTGENLATYGKDGFRKVHVKYTKDFDTYTIVSEHPEHLHGKQLFKKEDIMARFDNSTAKDIVNDVKEETIDVAQITLGKILYTNGVVLASRFVPQLKWYEKLFTSSKKREVALLVGSYVAIKVMQRKYSHYILDSISAYINFQLQTELLGGVTQDTLDKLFSKFEAVS